VRKQAPDAFLAADAYGSTIQETLLRAYSIAP
jgi:hypothetical protein